MAATEQLQFTNDPISLLSTSVLAGTFSGTLSVDYTTGAVTGSILTSPALGSTLQVLTYANFTETFNPTTNLYTLSSKDNSLLGLTTFSVSYATTTPMTANSSIALTLLPTVPVFGGTAGPVVTTPIPCFASGTRIRTLAGDRSVETLQIGDVLVTTAGAHRPIHWMGSRTTDCRRHPRPNEVMPVRIAAHAFGDNRPARDLYVSPNHSICVDIVGEVLTPAVALVNGSTIRQVDVDTITYWHVELDSHDILLAEGLAAESYIDMGNRGFFAESDVVNFAASPDADAAQRTIADYCRPFHDGGPIVEAIRAQLRGRAETLGWRMQDNELGDLHLVVDGERIEPTRQGRSACFMLPAGTSDVWLVSTAARPCDVESSSDTRRLGVSVAGISLIDGFGEKAVTLDDPRLGEGFDRVELLGDAIFRWTNGRACLPGELFAGAVGPRLLRVDLAGAALPQWREPEALAPRARLRLAS